MLEGKKSKPTSGRSARSIKKLLLPGAIVLALGAGVAYAARPKPIEAEMTQVRRGPLLVTVNEDGVSRIHDRYVVSAPLAGTLARIELHPGDEVKQAQILARLLPLSTPLLDARSRSEAEARVNAALAGLRQAKAQIERGRAAVDFAEKESKNTKELTRTGTLSRLDLEKAELEERSSRAELTSAQFAAKVAAHELAMAQSALGRFEGNAAAKGDQFEVTSPSTGRVLRVIQQSEGVVQAGTPLLEIGDPRALEIAVDVLTSDAVEIGPGARVTVGGWGGQDLEAVVRLVEPAAFSKVSSLGVEEQRVNTIIDLHGPYESWKALGDGYRVEARIVVYRNEQALQIPWSCLFRDGEDWAVFVSAAGVARQRQVDVGRRNETHAEILEGLTEGERVLEHPSDRVSDGVQVVALD